MNPTATAPLAPAVVDVLESLRDAYFKLDPAGRFVHLNRRAEELLGRPRAELLGRMAWEAAPRLLSDRFEVECRRALKSGQPGQFRTRDASLNILLQWQVYPSTSGLSAFARRQGARPEAEQVIHLLDAAGRLAALGDPEAVFQELASLAVPFLADHCIVDASAPDGQLRRAAVCCSGPDARVQQHALGTHPPGGLEIQAVKETLATGHALVFDPWPAGLDHVQTDNQSGLIVPLLGRGRPLGALILLSAHSSRHYGPFEVKLAEGLGVRAQAVLDDATRFNDMTAERNALSATLNSLSQAVFQVDVTGRLVQLNDEVCRMVGEPRSNLLGRHASDVFRWEDEAGRVLERDEYLLWRTLQTGEPADVRNRFFRTSTGKRVPLAITTTPIADANRRIVGAVEVVRDISRERETEELKDHIISLVSHELRTPLGHIKGFVSSLLETDVEWDAATQRDFLSEIDQETDRLAALVNDLLDMSRIEAGRAAPDRTWISLASVVREALRVTREAAAAHRVTTEFANDLPAVFADEAQIERVLTNLVENAAKYSSPGGGIFIEAHAGDDAVYCSVSDDGPAISAEYHELIFEKFFRIPTNAARRPGTGLGLPISRAIVEAHGGRLWVDSVPDGGNRFTFTLPLRAGAEYREGVRPESLG